jgi:hypothetical protein
VLLPAREEELAAENRQMARRARESGLPVIEIEIDTHLTFNRLPTSA